MGAFFNFICRSDSNRGPKGAGSLSPRLGENSKPKADVRRGLAPS